jgi:hypothetical protein
MVVLSALAGLAPKLPMGYHPHSGADFITHPMVCEDTNYYPHPNISRLINHLTQFPMLSHGKHYFVTVVAERCTIGLCFFKALNITVPICVPPVSINAAQQADNPSGFHYKRHTYCFLLKNTGIFISFILKK